MVLIVLEFGNSYIIIVLNVYSPRRMKKLQASMKALIIKIYRKIQLNINYRVLTEISQYKMFCTVVDKYCIEVLI